MKRVLFFLICTTALLCLLAAPALASPTTITVNPVGKVADLLPGNPFTDTANIQAAFKMPPKRGRAAPSNSRRAPST